jgi:hypothetical protein
MGFLSGVTSDLALLGTVIRKVISDYRMNPQLRQGAYSVLLALGWVELLEIGNEQNPNSMNAYSNSMNANPNSMNAYSDSMNANPNSINANPNSINANPNSMNANPNKRID